MTDYLLVDGHSVIFAWPELRALHTGPTRDQARAALIRRLTDYQDQTGVRVVVVFDGRGPRTKHEKTDPTGIQVSYAAGHSTADAVIERLTARYASQFRLTVATDDHMERQTAFSFGADTISTNTLREWLDAGAQDLTRRLRALAGKASRSKPQASRKV